MVAYIPRTSDGSTFSYLFVLQWSDWVIIPTEAICPARAFCRNGFALCNVPGICLQRVGKERGILEHAARHAFWRIPLTHLEKAAKELCITPSERSLYALVEALVRHALPRIKEEDLQAIMAMRGVPPCSPFPADLSEEVLQEVAGKDEVAGIKDFQQDVEKERVAAKVWQASAKEAAARTADSGGGASAKPGATTGGGSSSSSGTS
eukprot:5479344-Lingulodinium_polyedra.AAC.1